jgi:hypothetical protein
MYRWREEEGLAGLRAEEMQQQAASGCLHIDGTVGHSTLPPHKNTTLSIPQTAAYDTLKTPSRSEWNPRKL